MRGNDYARRQWLFVCAVHNVMKTVRFITNSGKSGAAYAIIRVAEWTRHVPANFL